MVAGVTAGQAKVKVVPDLERFASDLRSKLRDIEKTVKVTITANLKLDTAEARAELSRFAAETVNIKATIDTHELVTGVSGAIRDAQRYADTNRIKLRAELQLDRARIRADLDSLSGGSVTVNFNLDIAGARARAIIFKGYLDALFHSIKVKIEFDNADVAAFLAQIATLRTSLLGLNTIAGGLGGGGGGGGGGGRSGRGLFGFFGGLLSSITSLTRNALPNFANNLNTVGSWLTQLGSLLGGLSTSLQGFAGFLGQLGTRIQGLSQAMGPVAAVLGPVIQVIGGLAVAGVVAIAVSLLAAVISNLVGALLVAAGSITALTAGVVGFGLVLGSVIIGSQGVGTALGLAFGPQTADNVKKLKASLAGLAPSARAFVLELAHLQPQFQKIQQIVQQELFRGLAHQISAAAQVSLPAFSKALDTGARLANTFATELLRAFQNPVTAHDLLATIYNLLPGMNSLLASIRPLVQGFLDLSRATSGPLGGFLKSMGISFANFGRTLSSIAADPKFVGFLNQSFLVLSQIGSIAKDIVRTLSGLATGAAAGGTSLKPFSDAFAKLANFVNSPAGQKGLADFFRSAQDAVVKLQPALEAIGKAIVTVVDAAVTLAPPFADFVSSVLPPLVNGFTSVWTVLKPFAPLIAGVLIGAIAALAVVVGFVVFPFVALGLAIAVIGGLIAALVIGIVLLVQNFGTIIGAIGSFLGGVGAAIGGFFISLGQNLTNFVGSIGSAVGNFVMTILTGYWNNLKASLTSIGSFFSSTWNNIVSFVGSAISGIGSFISNLVSGGISKFNSLMNGIRSAVSNGLNAAVSFFSSLPGRILGILNGLIGSARNAGSAIVNGIASGIRSAIGAVTSSIQDVMQAISNFLPHSPAKMGPLSGRGWSLYSGQAIGDGLIQGMQSRQDAVSAAMNALLSPAGASAMSGDLNGTALINHQISLADQNLVLRIGDKDYNANLMAQLDARDTMTARTLVQGGPRGLF